MSKIYGNKDAKSCLLEVFQHTAKMKFIENLLTCLTDLQSYILNGVL